MSLIGGCSIHPESLTTSLMSTGAPHSGQVGEFGSLGCRQKRQTYWFIGPARYSEAWWWTYMDWMPTRPGPVISARYMRVPPHEPGPQRQLHRLHLHGGILVEEAARLHQDLLARAERALEDVAVAVQQQQARVLGRDEPVHEHAAAAVQHVRQPLDPDERVLDAVRGQQEGVLADVELHPRVQRQHDQLARRVPGERDPAWPVRHRDDVRHAAERALHPALRLQ